MPQDLPATGSGKTLLAQTLAKILDVPFAIADATAPVGTAPQNMLGNGALYTLKSRPTVDTDRMIDELGALIQDLQTFGDQAITKWKNK